MQEYLGQRGGGVKTLILLIFHKVFHIYVNKKNNNCTVALFIYHDTPVLAQGFLEVEVPKLAVIL